MTILLSPHPHYVRFRDNFLAIFVPGRGKWLHLVWVTSLLCSSDGRSEFEGWYCFCSPYGDWPGHFCENGFAMQITHLLRVSNHQLSQLFLRTLSQFYSVLWQMLADVWWSSLFWWQHRLHENHICYSDLRQVIQWISHSCKCFWNGLFGSLRANQQTTFSYCWFRHFSLLCSKSRWC